MDFEALLKLLLNRGVKFIVVGGVACALNGFVRATEDVDILIETTEANITAMLNTLREWGEGFAKEIVRSLGGCYSSRSRGRIPVSLSC